MLFCQFYLKTVTVGKVSNSVINKGLNDNEEMLSWES